MNEIKHSHDEHGAFGAPEGDRIHPRRRPYWKRAHRDWRFWAAVLSMLAAMTAYVMSDDLAFWPRSQSKPLSGAVGK